MGKYKNVQKISVHIKVLRIFKNRIYHPQAQLVNLIFISLYKIAKPKVDVAIMEYHTEKQIYWFSDLFGIE